MFGKYKFRVGQRVRPSAYGIASYLFRGKKKEMATGIVTHVDEFNSPTVKWDYRKTATQYYAEFIEPDRRRAAKTEPK